MVTPEIVIAAVLPTLTAWAGLWKQKLQDH